MVSLETRYIRVLSNIYDILEGKVLDNTEFVNFYKDIMFINNNENMLAKLLGTTFTLLHEHIANSLQDNNYLLIRYYYKRKIFPYLCKDLNDLIYNKLKDAYLEYIEEEKKKYLKIIRYLSHLFKHLDYLYLPKSLQKIVYQKDDIIIYYANDIYKTFKQIFIILKNIVLQEINNY